MYLAIAAYTALAAIFILFGDLVSTPLAALLKVLPILLLLCWAWLGAGSYRWLLLPALGFGMGGDIAMAFKLFIPGLALFLVGHLFYIALWSRQLDFSRYRRLLPLVLFVGAGSYFLLPKTGDMMVYVALYFFVISLMAASAQLSRLVNVFGSIGVYSFLLSDFVIGWNRFIDQLEWASLIIMLTYYLAQLFMLLSVIMYQKNARIAC